ncbi:MAG: hypothetical protein U0744_21775 [Gemmataceae bacterium]
MRIVIRGLALVTNANGVQITDPEELVTLHGLVYDTERFTDYMGGSNEEDALVAALVPGGFLSFEYAKGDLLIVTTEYQSGRELTATELKLLTEYTLAGCGKTAVASGVRWATLSATAESRHAWHR